MEAMESVQFGGTDVTAVDQVEELEEDEGVEDQGEVSHLAMACWCILDSLGSVGVLVANDCFASEHNNHHNGDHVQANTKDLAVHRGCHNVALTASEVSDFGSRTCGCKSESAKDVHDQVDPNEHHSVEC